MYGPCRVMVVMLSAFHSAYAFPSIPAPPFALVRAPVSVGHSPQHNAFCPSTRRPALQARLDVQTWEFEPSTTQGEEQGKAAADFGGFDWKKNWYPVAFDEYTDKSAPFAFTLLGERLVVWWDHKDAAWCAMKDVCPHRLAPLSEGRVNEKGSIECPYHGWAFDGSTGACTSIPHSATPERVHSDKRACGTALYTALEQGIIWVWAEPKKPGSALFSSETSEPPPSRALIPTCPAFDSEGVVSDDVSVDVPYDCKYLLVIQ
jgi:phenylpropionate dioxygenase-like ring-hydroxylating dioxygenase large terminal subunit